jgi:hypothetical protein
MRSVRWLVLVAALSIGGCRPYGSIASLATPDVRTSAVEFAGRWRAPDAMRCRSPGAGGGSRWSTTAAFEVRGDSSGWLQVQATPDAACPVEGNDLSDTLRYRGSVVRLGTVRLLELSLSDDALDESLLPLKHWHRITYVGDTLFLEQLNGDSLEAWLVRAPQVTPHRISSEAPGRDGSRRLVLTGDPKQLQAFARRAFATPGMTLLDTLVLVRDRPAGARGS